jgi:hypothetical protein
VRCSGEGVGRLSLGNHRSLRDGRGGLGESWGLGDDGSREVRGWVGFGGLGHQGVGGRCELNRLSGLLLLGQGLVHCVEGGGEGVVESFIAVLDAGGADCVEREAASDVAELVGLRSGGRSDGTDGEERQRDVRDVHFVGQVAWIL